jgi:hypothetical protein
LYFDGDGRADFVTLDSTGQKPVLTINTPSNLGKDFNTFDTPVDLPNTPAAPYTIGAPRPAYNHTALDTVSSSLWKLDGSINEYFQRGGGPRTPAIDLGWIAIG